MRRIAIILFLFLAAAARAQTLVQSITGSTNFDGFGRVVAMIGDVDVDGFPDFAVAAPDKSIGSQNQVGEVTIVSGFSGTIAAVLQGSVPFEQFGAALAGVGDVNGDGASDFIVGAPGARIGQTTVGAATVYSGVTFTVLSVFYGSAINDRFGCAVEGIGDINGDHVPDYAIGAHQYAPPNPLLTGGSPPGYVRVYSGLSQGVLMTIIGDQPDDAFGAVVTAAGDLDGDTVPDFLVGAHQHRSLFPGFLPPNPVGLVKAISGATGMAIYTLNADAYGDDFGHAIGVIGDVDGDNVLDFAVGAPFHDGSLFVDSGAVRLYSGATGTRILGIDGTIAGDQLGRSIGRAGDINGDGVEDIAAGAPFADNGTLTDAGAVKIFSSVNGQTLSSFGGSQTNELVGQSMDGLGGISRLLLVGTFGGTFLPGQAKLWDMGPGLPAVAAGYVPASTGGTQNVLTVNNSYGWIARRVDLLRSEPMTVRVDQPTQNPLAARFIIWGSLGIADQNSLYTAQGGLGVMCFAPYHLFPGTQWLFILANSFGPDPYGTLFSATTAPWMFTVPTGFPFAVTMTIQGLIEIAPIPGPGSVAFTNAVGIQIR